MNDEQEERRLRLSKEVRIGELIAALVAISALATGYIELRLQPIAQQITALERAATVQADAAQEFKREVRGDLQRVEAKLDRLLESLRVPR